MEFKDKLSAIGSRVESLKNSIQTEEATKNAFIMPFMQALGYDVFNPLEVIPEFTSDVGIKTGEKVDYAILKEGLPILLIECKHWSQNLDKHSGQLLRYFHVSKAKFGILTNGIVYKFFSDIDEPNKMDSSPFLEFNIQSMTDSNIVEVKKFHKDFFDSSKILSSANELKYMNETKKIVSQEFSSPSPEFVKLFAKQVYKSIITAQKLEFFTDIVKRSVQQHVTEIIALRLKNALEKEVELNTPTPKEEGAPISKIVTTDEEIESFLIVKAILRNHIDTKRIIHRDAQTYFAILLDDNNRKPICRLYLNSSKKYLAVLDAEKREIKHEISTLDDIYSLADVLIKAVSSYEEVL